MHKIAMAHFTSLIIEGKRSCLGEILAKQEFFIFFVRILQEFEITHASGDAKNIPEEKDLCKSGQFVRHPIDVDLKFTKRNK